MSDKKLKSCPFCTAESFEEISPGRELTETVKLNEQKFDRINHKQDCYMNNKTGDRFERFARHNNKDPDSRHTPKQKREAWNRRPK